jgi:hypothetical protein
MVLKLTTAQESWSLLEAGMVQDVEEPGAARLRLRACGAVFSSVRVVSKLADWSILLG